MPNPSVRDIIEYGVHSQTRDPDLAQKTMGGVDPASGDNIVVLPAPMMGQYRSSTLTVIDLQVSLLPDSSPVLLQELLNQLQDHYDLIRCPVAEGNDDVNSILVDYGFVSEQVWDPNTQTYQTFFVWHKPTPVYEVVPVDAP